MEKEIITREQLTKLFDYLRNDTRQATFRYLIYNVMGFKSEDYSWLYSTGLMGLKDMIYDYRDKIKRLENEK